MESIFVSRFSEFLTFGTLICFTARRSQAADPLVAWGGCAWPRFQAVKYNLYWTVFRKLSKITFCEGNTDYIVRWRGANPALWLADRYVVDYIYHIYIYIYKYIYCGTLKSYVFCEIMTTKWYSSGENVVNITSCIHFLDTNECNLFSPWANGGPHAPPPPPPPPPLWSSASGTILLRGLSGIILAMLPGKKLGLTTNFGHFSKWPPQNLRFPISRKLLHVGSWFGGLNLYFLGQGIR